MSEELAWAAGFYDGEGGLYGHVTRGRPRVNGTRSRDYITPSMSVAQKDRRPLDRFLAAVGEGRVFGPYRQESCPIYFYRATGRVAVSTYEKIKPWLSEPKIEQAEAVLAAYAEQKATKPRKQVCKHGHDLTAQGALRERPGGRRECRACYHRRNRARNIPQSGDG